MKHVIFLYTLLIPIVLNAQNTGVTSYEIDLRIPEKEIFSEHLKLGGTNFKGTSYEVNNFYISKNDKPSIPITGEFHFSRYPEVYWEEAIQKMKTGGINMLATYVFWNTHEEVEGEFIWNGNRDLRKFIKLCAQHEMLGIMRINYFW